ncbi:MAG: HAD family hydrolase, partial [Candidatus Omnitrophica bacterium]|nr:HAD family hydrolase [Candidatus Omnitrophota bacterium]
IKPGSSKIKDALLHQLIVFVDRLIAHYQVKQTRIRYYYGPQDSRYVFIGHGPVYRWAFRLQGDTLTSLNDTSVNAERDLMAINQPLDWPWIEKNLELKKINWFLSSANYFYRLSSMKGVFEQFLNLAGGGHLFVHRDPLVLRAAMSAAFYAIQNGGSDTNILQKLIHESFALYLRELRLDAGVLRNRQVARNLIWIVYTTLKIRKRTADISTLIEGLFAFMSVDRLREKDTEFVAVLLEKINDLILRNIFMEDLEGLLQAIDRNYPIKDALRRYPELKVPFVQSVAGLLMIRRKDIKQGKFQSHRFDRYVPLFVGQLKFYIRYSGIDINFLDQSVGLDWLKEFAVFNGRYMDDREVRSAQDMPGLLQQERELIRLIQQGNQAAWDAYGHHLQFVVREQLEIWESNLRFPLEGFDDLADRFLQWGLTRYDGSSYFSHYVGMSINGFIRKMYPVHFYELKDDQSRNPDEHRGSYVVVHSDGGVLNDVQINQVVALIHKTKNLTANEKYVVLQMSEGNDITEIADGLQRDEDYVQQLFNSAVAKIQKVMKLQPEQASSPVNNRSMSGVFDLDLTLVNTRNEHNQSWMDAFLWKQAAVKGISLTFDLIEEYMRGRAGHEGIELLIRNGHFIQMSAEQIQHLYEFKMERFYQLIAGRSVEVFPGVAALLESLIQRHGQIGIATNNRDPHAVMDSAGLLKYFRPQMIISAADVARHYYKPHPFMPTKLALLMKTEPIQMFFVGDTAIDMQAAKAAGFGLKVAINHSGLMASQLRLIEAGADRVVNRFDEITIDWLADALKDITGLNRYSSPAKRNQEISTKQHVWKKALEVLDRQLIQIGRGSLFKQVSEDSVVRKLKISTFQKYILENEKIRSHKNLNLRSITKKSSSWPKTVSSSLKKDTDVPLRKLLDEAILGSLMPVIPGIPTFNNYYQFFVEDRGSVRVIVNLKHNQTQEILFDLALSGLLRHPDLVHMGIGGPTTDLITFIGQGVSRELKIRWFTQVLFTRLASLGFKRLRVTVENENAIPLFNDLGFVLVSRQKTQWEKNFKNMSSSPVPSMAVKETFYMFKYIYNRLSPENKRRMRISVPSWARKVNAAVIRPYGVDQRVREALRNMVNYILVDAPLDFNSKISVTLLPIPEGVKVFIRFIDLPSSSSRITQLTGNLPGSVFRKDRNEVIVAIVVRNIVEKSSDPSTDKKNDSLPAKASSSVILKWRGIIMKAMAYIAVLFKRAKAVVLGVLHQHRQNGFAKLRRLLELAYISNPRGQPQQPFEDQEQSVNLLNYVLNSIFLPSSITFETLRTKLLLSAGAEFSYYLPHEASTNLIQGKNTYYLTVTQGVLQVGYAGRAMWKWSKINPTASLIIIGVQADISGGFELTVKNVTDDKAIVVEITNMVTQFVQREKPDLEAVRKSYYLDSLELMSDVEMDELIRGHMTQSRHVRVLFNVAIDPSAIPLARLFSADETWRLIAMNQIVGVRAVFGDASLDQLVLSYAIERDLSSSPVKAIAIIAPSRVSTPIADRDAKLNVLGQILSAIQQVLTQKSEPKSPEEMFKLNLAFNHSRTVVAEIRQRIKQAMADPDPHRS